MRSARTLLPGLLAMAVLGVLAFASSAQAITELGSGFFVGGVQAGVSKGSVEAKQLGRSTISVPALSMEINCEKFSLVRWFHQQHYTRRSHIFTRRM